MRLTDTHRAWGAAWYPLAYQQATAIATATGYSPDTVAAVMAALSLRCSWKVNVDWTWRICQDRGATVSTLANRAKAVRLLHGEAPLDVLRGSKVRAFYAAIIGDLHAIVVDVWIARALRLGTDAPRGLAYDRAAERMRRRAKRAGLPPRDYQAALWCAVRGGAI